MVPHAVLLDRSRGVGLQRCFWVSLLRDGLTADRMHAPVYLRMEDTKMNGMPVYLQATTVRVFNNALGATIPQNDHTGKWRQLLQLRCCCAVLHIALSVRGYPSCPLKSVVNMSSLANVAASESMRLHISSSMPAAVHFMYQPDYMHILILA
jgi:hypothetical protein